MNETYNKLEADQTFDTLSVVKALLLLPGCCIGTACHLLAFIVMTRHQIFWNAFGRLAACYAFLSAVFLFMFIVWAAPFTIWPVPEYLQHLNRRMGVLTMGIYATSLHCSLFISINRFVAIAFPFEYRRIAFTHRKAYAVVAVIAVIYALYASAFLMDGCDFFYSYDLSKWQYGSEPCAVFFASYLDFYYDTSMTVAFTVIDVITMVRLRWIKQGEASRRAAMNGEQRKEAAKVDGQEMRFFIQSVLSTGIPTAIFFIYFIMVPLATTKFQLFLCTTFAWSSSHAISGVVLVICNPEIRRHLPFMSLFQSRNSIATLVR